MKGLADCANPLKLLCSLYDRAEAGEKDVVLRFVLDGDDLVDPGLIGGLEDRLAGIGRRIGGEGSVADRRLLENGRLSCGNVRIHG